MLEELHILAEFSGVGGRGVRLPGRRRQCEPDFGLVASPGLDRKSTRLNSSHLAILFYSFSLHGALPIYILAEFSGVGGRGVRLPGRRRQCEPDFGLVASPG